MASIFDILGQELNVAPFVDIPLPDVETAEQLLNINLTGVPLAEGFSTAELAKKMAGYSGADVTIVRVMNLRPTQSYID